MTTTPTGQIGALGGLCNRTSCRESDRADNPATHYNHSTRKFYCRDCADILNRANANDSWVKSLGHALCTEGAPQ